MKIIMFKSGHTCNVDQEVANKLKDIILSKDGAKPWQCFTDPKGECITIINLLEVEYIGDPQ